MHWHNRIWNWMTGSDAARLTPLEIPGRTTPDGPEGGSAGPLSRQPPAGVALSRAVEEFNQLAAQNDLGRRQSPLTVDEVVTAIRSAGRHQLPLMEPHRLQVYAIAETLRLPLTAGLRFTTHWSSSTGYRCEVWWIDLVMYFPLTDSDQTQSSVCSLRVRDLRLRSWSDPTIRIPTEIQRLQADQRWFPNPSGRTEATTRH